jgi:hypothetical protein
MTKPQDQHSTVKTDHTTTTQSMLTTSILMVVDLQKPREEYQATFAGEEGENHQLQNIPLQPKRGYVKSGPRSRPKLIQPSVLHVSWK